jgi:hypothetical protein
MQQQQQSPNTDEYGYYFDDAEFSGESGEQALEEALKSAAELAGFELCVANRKKHIKESMRLGEIRFTCSHSRICRSAKLEEMENNLLEADGTVLLPGLVHQNIKKNHAKSGKYPRK